MFRLFHTELPCLLQGIFPTQGLNPGLLHYRQNVGDWVLSLGQEDPPEEGMTTYSSILAGEFHGQRTLTGYSPWVLKKSLRLLLLDFHYLQNK